MHLLAAQAGALQQEGEAIDLAQSPADIVFASAADSEMLVPATCVIDKVIASTSLMPATAARMMPPLPPNMAVSDADKNTMIASSSPKRSTVFRSNGFFSGAASPDGVARPPRHGMSIATAATTETISAAASGDLP